MKKDLSAKKVICRQLKGRQRFLRLLGDGNKVNGLRCGLVTLKPKEEIGEHKTTAKEEVIIVLKGNAIICYSKNKIIKAVKDDFVYIPPNILHNVKNFGRKILQYVYVTTKVT